MRWIWLTLLASLLFASTAFAGDYSVSYAIDANGKIDKGIVDTCKYVEVCGITSAALGVTLSLGFTRPDHDSIELEISGPPGCCYSVDTNRTFYLDTRRGLQRMPIYLGHQRKGNEFVRNERFGFLYLEFSNLR
jgi:hypothetical protein